MIEDLSIDLMKMRDKVLSQIKEKNKELDALKQDLADILKMQKRQNYSKVQRVITESEDEPLVPIIESITSKEALRRLLTANPSKFFAASEIASYFEELRNKKIMTFGAKPLIAAYNALQKLAAKGFAEKKTIEGKVKYRKKQ